MTNDVLTEDYFTKQTFNDLLAANQKATEGLLETFRDTYNTYRDRYANPRNDPCYNVLRTHKKEALASLELLLKHVENMDFSKDGASEKMQGYIASLVENWLSSCLLVTAPAYQELFDAIGDEDVLDEDEELELLQQTYQRVNDLLQSYYEARRPVFDAIPGLFTHKYMSGVQMSKLRELSRGGKTSRAMTQGMGFSPFWGVASTSTDHIGKVVGVSRPPAVLLGTEKSLGWDSVIAICKDHDDGAHRDHYCYNTNTELWAAETDLLDLQTVAGRRVDDLID